MNHATFKASLFMAVGIIDHETGTRDIRRLSGLFRLMPITGTLALVATAAMAGVPLLNGFLSKEMFFAETVFVDAVPASNGGCRWRRPSAGMGSVAYSLRFALGVFFGPARRATRRESPEEPPRWMRVPDRGAGARSASWSASRRRRPSARCSRPPPGRSSADRLPPYSLKLWHGFTPAAADERARDGRRHRRCTSRTGGSARRLAAAAAGDRPELDGARALHLARWRWLTAGSRSDSRAGCSRPGSSASSWPSSLVALLVGALHPAGGASAQGDRPLVPLSPIFVGLWLMGGGRGGAAPPGKRSSIAWRRSCSSGRHGRRHRVTFIWFSAPDLALTQLTVEVVTTLLILVGLRWLPRPRAEARGVYNRRTRRSAIRRGARVTSLVAVGAGSGMAILAYAVMTRDFPERTSFFLEKALTGGGGRNVVNVMLVDFRGFDTFGEGVVLALVALTVYALLRRFRPAPEVMTLPPQQQAAPEGPADGSGQPATGATIRRWDTSSSRPCWCACMLPVSGVVASFFFLRGHNAPGGGFVAGLVMSIGLLLQYIVVRDGVGRGARAARARGR